MNVPSSVVCSWYVLIAVRQRCHHILCLPSPSGIKGTSISKIVNEDEIVNILFDGRQTFSSLLKQAEGSRYIYLTPGISNRHYGQINFWAGEKGQVYLKEKFEIGAWKEMIGVLLPVDDGFLSIKCTMFSDLGTVPDEQAKFAYSLIQGCYALVAKADAK